MTQQSLMTPSAPKRLNNIQALRGMAALLVAFTHLAPTEVKYGGHSILPEFLKLGVSGVDIFFVISGFIMVYVTWDLERSTKASLKFLFARITRIYPIYWLIAVAVLIAWMVVPTTLNFELENASLIKSFLLWPDHTLPMLKVAWTLIHEMYFYIVFAFILLLPKRALLPALGLWCLAVTTGNLSGLDKNSPESALIFHPLTLEFFMGGLAAWVFMKTQGTSAKPSLGFSITGFGIAGFITALIYMSVTLAPGEYPSNWARVVCFGIPATLIIYGLSAIEHKNFVLPTWSSTFGDWSYSFYLSHVLSFSLLGLLWKPFARPGPVDNIIVLVILLAGAIFISALLWYLFEKPVLTGFKYMRVKLFS